MHPEQAGEREELQPHPPESISADAKFERIIFDEERTPTEEELDQAIAGTQSFRELYRVIQLAGGIKGNKSHTAKHLFEILARVANGGNVDALPQRLKSKVWELKLKGESDKKELPNGESL